MKLMDKGECIPGRSEGMRNLVRAGSRLHSEAMETMHKYGRCNRAWKCGLK